MGRVKRETQQYEQPQVTRETQCRLKYDVEQEPFEAYCVRVSGGNHWESRVCYPVARIYGTGNVQWIPWTEELLIEALQPTLRSYRNTYGGQWELRVVMPNRIPCPIDRDGNAREKAHEFVLAGLDTAGRRWLLRNKGKSAPLIPALKTAPPLPRPVRVASREMVDRLRKPLELTGNPIQADEEWFNAESEKLRAEELAACVPPEDEIPF